MNKAKLMEKDKIIEALKKADENKRITVKQEPVDDGYEPSMIISNNDLEQEPIDDEFEDEDDIVCEGLVLKNASDLLEVPKLTTKPNDSKWRLVEVDLNHLPDAFQKNEYFKRYYKIDLIKGCSELACRSLNTETKYCTEDGPMKTVEDLRKEMHAFSDKFGFTESIDEIDITVEEIDEDNNLHVADMSSARMERNLSTNKTKKGGKGEKKAINFAKLDVNELIKKYRYPFLKNEGVYFPLGPLPRNDGVINTEEDKEYIERMIASSTYVAGFEKIVHLIAPNSTQKNTKEFNAIMADMRTCQKLSDVEKKFTNRFVGRLQSASVSCHQDRREARRLHRENLQNEIDGEEELEREYRDADGDDIKSRVVESKLIQMHVESAKRDIYSYSYQQIRIKDHPLNLKHVEDLCVFDNDEKELWTVIYENLISYFRNMPPLPALMNNKEVSDAVSKAFEKINRNEPVKESYTYY
ncbi:unnamed protein product [Caenorhabditis bovis]|uniref:Uncharacterized protein n=1 Tax=Caenorhabditis bovis TaxID=2654633 RepID=A0A8S1EQG6_9PELO|nr:unnamed protein product [Caenorhabditis bovis]